MCGVKAKRFTAMTGFRLALIFASVHTVVALLFIAIAPPYVGEHSDLSSIVWFVWGAFDFPLGILALWLASEQESNAIAALLLIVLGGLQWAFWGFNAGSDIDERKQKEAKRH
jgi:ascorbate-specific PTS system EIIC-type component UlaA